MRKIYLDATQLDQCIGVFASDAEVLLAGTTVNAMSVKHKNRDYQRFAEEYDIHFIFADHVPRIDFYTVPMVDIFAADSVGGYIGSIGQPTDLEADIPICYIDADKKCYLIAENGEDFLKKVHRWKEYLTPCADIDFFESLKLAREKYEFLDSVELEQKESSMTIRYALPSDLAALAAVEAECFPAAEAATEKDIKNRLDHYADHFWLLFHGDKLVSFVDGFVTDEADLTDEMYEKAELHNKNGAWQMIFGVNTVPAYRRRGCAEQLLRRAIDDARAQGRKGLVLTCKDTLIHYYEKFGFINEGVSASVHGNVVWYQMRLTF